MSAAVQTAGMKFVLPALILLATSSLAQPLNVLSPRGAFSERLNDRVPVSGRTLVGLVYTRGPGSPEGLALNLDALRLIASADGTTCIRAVSQDGRYEAENEFVLNGTPGAAARVVWPSGHLDYLRQRPVQEFATLASPGPCSGRQSSLLPLQTTNGGDRVAAYVNTRGATLTAVMTAGGGGAARRVRCARTTGGVRLAFDAVCDFGPLALGGYELRVEAASLDGMGVELLERISVLISPP